MQEGKALLNMADDNDKPKGAKVKAKVDKVGKKSARTKPSTRPQAPGDSDQARPAARSKGGDKSATALPAKAAVEQQPNKALGLLNELKKYLKAVKAEFHRVTWPTKQELRAATLVVIVILVVVTTYLFAVNSFLNVAFEKLAG